MSLYDRELPKWPQVIITGKKVSEEQALEIIRRTDAFFDHPSGNNRSFVKAAKEALHLHDDSDDLLHWPGVQAPNCEHELYRAIANACYEYSKKWLAEWGYLKTEYIRNDWVSCSYIGGPHGWMHPDGTIGFTDNVGKWPEVADLYADFKTIAEAFPFLEMEATVMDGEDCEDNTKPVVGFIINNGTVTVVEPEEVDALRTSVDRSNIKLRDLGESITRRFSADNSFENTFSLDQIKLWYDQVFSKKDNK